MDYNALEFKFLYRKIVVLVWWINACFFIESNNKILEETNIQVLYLFNFLKYNIKIFYRYIKCVFPYFILLYKLFGSYQ